MIRFAYDKGWFRARREGVPYRQIGRGWGWIYIGPILIGRRR